MCAGGKVGDALFRPHRLFGGPSLLDPMLHPNDKYNLPKQAKPNPVVERQAYVAPVPRQASTTAARRRLMGVSTSAQGLSGAASTTRAIGIGGGG